MKNFRKCCLCLSHAERELKSMPLCDYHFVIISQQLPANGEGDIHT